MEKTIILEKRILSTDDYIKRYQKAHSITEFDLAL